MPSEKVMRANSGLLFWRYEALEIDPITIICSDLVFDECDHPGKATQTAGASFEVPRQRELVVNLAHDSIYFRV